MRGRIPTCRTYGGRFCGFTGAARVGDVESVRVLIRPATGRSPTRTAQSITSPLMKMLAATGKLNTSTPLTAACEIGNVDVVRELLKHKPDLSWTNNRGKTAYDLARKHNHRGIVRLLREAGEVTPARRTRSISSWPRRLKMLPVSACPGERIPIDTVGGVAPNQLDVEKS